MWSSPDPNRLSQIPSSLCMYCYIHCVCVARLLYPLLCGWAFWNLHALAVNNTPVKSGVHLSFWRMIFSGCFCLGAGVPGHHHSCFSPWSHICCLLLLLLPFYSGCREPAWGIPPVTRSCGKSSDGKANQTSGFPPGISWASTPQKIRICLLFHSSDILWKKVNSGL